MNDFTKEELEQLKSNILNMRLFTDIDIWDENLLIKLQSLIENYCDDGTEARYDIQTR